MNLDQTVRLVSMQFSFSNFRFVPESVRMVPDEEAWQAEARKNTTAGVEFLKPTENCSALSFANDLKHLGYEMVDAFAMKRWKEHHVPYAMVRFVFAAKKYVKISDEFRAKRKAIEADLIKMCSDAMWRVRAYNNPYFLNGDETSERALSINMEVRQPLYLPDGRPIKARRKEGGVAVGNPIPLHPDHKLVIINRDIKIVSNALPILANCF